MEEAQTLFCTCERSCHPLSDFEQILKKTPQHIASCCLCFGFGILKQLSLSWPGAGVLPFARAELWDREGAGGSQRDGNGEAMIGWLQSCLCAKPL